jgi:FimV-like protein
MNIQIVVANVDTYQTKKGDTLFKIAAKLQEQREDEDFTDQQLAFALYKHNPLAFQTCNLFALKIGTVLKLPQDQFIATFNPQHADLEIKRQQQQWKTAKGKINKIVCSLPPDSNILEMPLLSATQISADLLPFLEDIELKDNFPTPLSPPLSAILTIPFKPLIPDFYSIDLIDNLQDLPSLELIRTTPFEELPLSTKTWNWWQILITLSGFLWGFWQWFNKQIQSIENKEVFNIQTPQVLEIATLDTDNLCSEFNTVETQSEEHQEEPLYVITSFSFESILKETFQNWDTPINSITPSNMEEIFSEEELAQWATNEPVIDRQMLEKVFQLN